MALRRHLTETMRTTVGGGCKSFGEDGDCSGRRWWVGESQSLVEDIAVDNFDFKGLEKEQSIHDSRWNHILF